MRSGIGGLVRAGPRGLLQFTRYLSADFLLFGHPIISVRVTLRVQHDYFATSERYVVQTTNAALVQRTPKRGAMSLKFTPSRFALVLGLPEA